MVLVIGDVIHHVDNCGMRSVLTVNNKVHFYLAAAVVRSNQADWLDNNVNLWIIHADQWYTLVVCSKPLAWLHTSHSNDGECQPPETSDYLIQKNGVGDDSATYFIFKVALSRWAPVLPS